jgi:eukaryotic-like serine/threonine-protein kinase
MPRGVETSACPGDDVLGAHVQRALDAHEAQLVTAHLDDCAACRQLVIAAVRGGMAAAPETLALGTPPPPAGQLPLGPVPGDRIGRYQIVKLLGAGGMGRVYAAYDAELERSIALKVLRPELAASAGLLAERLMRESRLMAKVTHPSVITVHDVGRSGDAVFIAMELIRGETLGAYARRVKPGWREVLDIMERAGAGLAAAHATGIVHRDFKPENVLVHVKDGVVDRVVVTDFGVARAASEVPLTPMYAPLLARGGVADPRLTATGMAVGTPAYMAPEQLDGDVADQRADVFAFAVSAWELLFGARPFPGKTVAEIRAALLEPLRAPKGGVPRRVVRVLVRALARDRSERWPDMPSLVRALQRARPQRRGLAVAAAAAVVVLGAGGFAATRYYAAGEDDPCARSLAAADAAYSPLRELQLRGALASDPKLRDTAVERLRKARASLRDSVTAACHAPVPSANVTACLEARRVELAGVAEDLALDGPRYASIMLNLVGGPKLCKPDTQGMSARVPDDRALRRRVTELRHELFDAEHARESGDYKRAIASVTRISAAAKDLWPRLQAETLYVLATIESQGGDAKKGMATMREAAALAERVHHDYIATNAWIQLAQNVTGDSGDPQRGLEYITYADAALDRIGRPPDVLAMLEYTRGVALVDTARYKEGEVALRKSVELSEQSSPDTLPMAIQGLGYLYEDQGRFEEAVTMYRRALDGMAKLVVTPVAAVLIRDRLAVCLSTLGKAEEAEREARRAVELADRVLDPANIDRAIAHTNLAQVLDEAGQFEAALAEAEGATRAIGKYGERTQRYAEVVSLEASILVDLDRNAEADKRFARACEIMALVGGDSATVVAECNLRRSGALHGMHKDAEAARLLDTVLPMLEAAYGPRHVQLAEAHASRGVIRAELGRHAEALSDLELAVSIYGESTVDPTHLAHAQIALGMEAWAKDKARGRALVTQGLDTLAKADAATWAETRHEAETWLASHH